MALPIFFVAVFFSEYLFDVVLQKVFCDLNSQQALFSYSDSYCFSAFLFLWLRLARRGAQSDGGPSGHRIL